MAKRNAKTAIEIAAERLRSIALGKAEGELMGSEEAVTLELACSRSTVRQAARLLEREGLVRVRRGINGGYFAARPDAGTIEATVASYLESIEMDNHDITVIASALWVEAVRKAARANAAVADSAIERIRRQVTATKPSATFEQVRDIELASQLAVFELASSNYIKLIFDINTAFSARRFKYPNEDEVDEHAEFVNRWRNAKLLELGAIANRDVELAVMAARRVRRIWHKRVYARHRDSYGDSNSC